MSKFKSITDGMKIVDTSLAEGGYNYYGSVRHNGEYVIMRENVAQTEYRFKLGADNYSANWTIRTTLTYGLPTIS